MVKMYRLSVHKVVFCFILVFNIVTGKQCDPSDAVTKSCPENQMCNSTTKLCDCQPGFVKLNDTYCKDTIPHSTTHSTTPKSSSLIDNSGNGYVVAGILVPLFLILFVIYGVYVSRKYDLFSWIRMKIHQRNSNYDEFMIGQDLEDDDPPLR